MLYNYTNLTPPWALSNSSLMYAAHPNKSRVDIGRNTSASCGHFPPIFIKNGLWDLCENQNWNFNFLSKTSKMMIFYRQWWKTWKSGFHDFKMLRISTGFSPRISKFMRFHEKQEVEISNSIFRTDLINRFK